MIHTIDLHFQGISETIASYLVVGPDGPILIETGPSTTLANLVAAVADHGYSVRDVRHVLVTHIHLDHAGAAGWWARQGATVYVHEVGAPHLIDPSKLLSSASRIYGDMMDILWGEVLAAPRDRVHIVKDGEELNLAGLTLRAIDTPGHAYHHHVYRLGDVGFTGDAAGISIPDTELADIPAPPPEFNFTLWLKTVERLQGEQFEAIYPTHFGRIDDVASHLESMRQELIEVTEFVRVEMEAGQEREQLVDSYLARFKSNARAKGLSDEDINRYELANPHFMSVDGIMRYWRKRQQKKVG